MSLGRGHTQFPQTASLSPYSNYQESHPAHLSDGETEAQSL